MKGLYMKRYLSILLIISIPLFVSAAEHPLQITPSIPKISINLNDTLQVSSDNKEFKVWVFLTDKEIFDDAAYKITLQKISERFTPRAIKRRQTRSGNPNPDYYDIPVSENYVSQLQSAGFKVVTKSRWLNAVSGYGNRTVLEKLAEISFVASIRPVGTAKKIEPPVDILKPTGTPPADSGAYGGTFHQLEMVKIPVMHRLGYSGKGVLMAFFDSGFKTDLPVFDSLHLINAYDFVNNDTSVGDTECASEEHGTTTLSISAGYDSGQYIGAAYGADYILAKTENTCSESQVEEDYWAAGAEWADSLGADIISSSLEYYDWYTYQDMDGNTAIITIAADLAVSRGIAVFSSAGNTRNDPFHFVSAPGDGDSVIAVGAVSPEGIICSFSAAGPTYDGRIKPDLVAQGCPDYIATAQGGFGTASGTSYSTPLAAGAGALLLEAHPDWTPMRLREAMISSADRYLNPDTLYGYGLFNTLKAADLFRINPIGAQFVKVGDSLNIHITTSGMEDSSRTIVGQNLPDSAVFVDNGDGTADFGYLGQPEDIGSRTISFIASAGEVTYTQDVALNVFSRAEISAGPNPFSDSIVIFLGSLADKAVNISIYSVAGEKVWEQYSDIGNRTGISEVWYGINEKGQQISPGVYFMIVKTEKSVEKIKLFKK
jgi:serine protease AprX